MEGNSGWDFPSTKSADWPESHVFIVYTVLRMSGYLCWRHKWVFIPRVSEFNNAGLFNGAGSKMSTIPKKPETFWLRHLLRFSGVVHFYFPHNKVSLTTQKNSCIGFQLGIRLCKYPGHSLLLARLILLMIDTLVRFRRGASLLGGQYFEVAGFRGTTANLPVAGYLNSF